MSLLDTYTVIPWKTALWARGRSRLAEDHLDFYEAKYQELLALGFGFSPAEGPYFGTDDQLTDDGWFGSEPHDGQTNAWLDIDKNEDGWFPNRREFFWFDFIWEGVATFDHEQPSLFRWHEYVTDPATLLSKNDRYNIGMLHRWSVRQMQVKCGMTLANLAGLDNRGRPPQ